MDDVKSIHYVLQEMYRRYSLNYVSTRDDIMMMCVEYDVDKYYTEIESILAKMMPIGSIGTVDYPFSDDTDIA